MTEFNQQDVTVLEEQIVYDGFFKMKSLRLNYALFEGGVSAEVVRELCVRRDAAGILLYDPLLQKIALVEQMRIGALGRDHSPWMLEIVAGILDKVDEDTAELVKRESLEEAGLEVLDLEPMMDYYSSAGGSSEKLSLYCGRVDLQGVKSAVFGVAEENEDIRLHIFNVDEIFAMLDRNDLNNAMTIISVQWFQLSKEKLDQAWSLT